jgi:formylglycine-generating enzyme required for sulfatase activity
MRRMVLAAAIVCSTAIGWSQGDFDAPKQTAVRRVARVYDTNRSWSAPETLAAQLKLRRAIVMKAIPAGVFTMGSGSSLDFNAAPSHQVTLSAFRMQETEVTQEQYLAVMGSNPAHFDTGAGAALRPVEQVSWYHAARYCNALSALDGADPVYDTITWVADVKKNGYRLPTEAQWEYACRAKSTTAYWWGNDDTGIDTRAWFADNSGTITHAVATTTPNAFGLYDMTGNVFEWCNDWFGAYGSAAQTDPIGPKTGSFRVIRGGCWVRIAYPVRSAARCNYNPDFAYDSFGFRVVCPAQ